MLSQIIITIAVSLFIIVVSIGVAVFAKQAIVTLWEEESYVELFLSILFLLAVIILIGILLKAIGL